jgi:hypothetical protein
VDPAADNDDVLRGTGGKWSIGNAPNAGGSGFSDIPGGITNIDGQLRLAGTYTTATSNNLPLIGAPLTVRIGLGPFFFPERTVAVP